MNNHFCQNCGAQITEGAAFCGGCGAQTAAPQAQAQQDMSGLVGFSPKINDPAFASHRRKSAMVSFIFAGIVTVIALIAIPIYGSNTGKYPWPNSLYAALGLSGMFWAIALVIEGKKSLDKTWDGVVESKNTRVVRNETASSNSRYKTYERVYDVKVRKDSGGSKSHRWSSVLYNYYNVGDRVRHHKGFLHYEKYDKSKDSLILCAACTTFNDINLDKCKQCKCPLLKNN